MKKTGFIFLLVFLMGCSSSQVVSPTSPPEIMKTATPFPTQTEIPPTQTLTPPLTFTPTLIPLPTYTPLPTLV